MSVIFIFNFIFSCFVFIWVILNLSDYQTFNITFKSIISSNPLSCKDNYLFFSCEKKENDSNNGNSKEIIISEDIIVNTTWIDDKIYVIDNVVNIGKNAVLTIEPGTIIKFKPNSSLGCGWWDYGTLIAKGTAEKPITFTSYANNPSTGDYSGLFFGEYNSTTATTLEHCIIEYAGAHTDYPAGVNVCQTIIKMQYCTIQKCLNDGIKIEPKATSQASQLVFANNTIKQCGGHAIVIDINTVHALGGNTLEVQSGYGIQIINSDYVVANGIWKNHGVRYYPRDGINISSPTGAKLTIEPGCTILFASNGNFDVGWWDEGSLVANGTIENPITFSSASQNPSPGDWNGIAFGEYLQTGSILNYCNISYGGALYDYPGNVIIWDTGFITISNCNISYSLNHGIWINVDAMPVLLNNSFSNNGGDNVFTAE